VLNASAYLRTVAPALPISATKHCCTSYLTAQGSVMGINSVTAVSAVATPLLSWLLVTRMGWGLVGAAAAYVIGGWLRLHPAHRVLAACVARAVCPGCKHAPANLLDPGEIGC
jgi:Na+-driven multidrug efflux pump